MFEYLPLALIGLTIGKLGAGESVLARFANYLRVYVASEGLLAITHVLWVLPLFGVSIFEQARCVTPTMDMPMRLYGRKSESRPVQFFLARQRNIRSFAIRGPNSYIGWHLISLPLFRVLRLLVSSRWAFVCALASVLALALTLPAWGGEQGNASASQVQGQFGSGRKFREIIGLQVKFYQGQPQSDLPSLSDLRVRWVREEIGWDQIEPSPGRYREFPPALKERLAYYRQHDIGVVFLLAYSNSVAYPATREAPYRPADPEAFGRYAVEVARILRAEGVSFVLELWNEPHNSLRPLVGGAWNGKPPSPWVDHYVKMVREAVKQVKSFDPTIKLLTDDDMWILHYWFLEAGLPRELDGFAFHPYTKGNPEEAAVDFYTDWVKPFTVVDPDRSFGSAVRRLREQGQTKLGKSPEMWITEWGWPIGGNSGKGEVSEEVLAGFLPRAFIMAEAAGVQVMCWFSAQDTVDGPMGLTTNDGKRRKSYYAFKTMSEQLGDYVLVRQVGGAKHPTSGVQAFLFHGVRDDKLVVWNVDGSQQHLALHGATAIDALGNPVSPEQGYSGGARISFGSAPIYVSGVRAEEMTEASLATPD